MANELHTMPLKIESLMSSHKVRLLELDEFGGYIKLLCDAWLNGGKLPENATSNACALQKLCQCNATTAERILENVVKVFFEADGNGNIYNKRQAEIYNGVCHKCVKAKEKAEKAAAVRWGKNGDAPSIQQAMHEECQPKPKSNVIITPISPKPQKEPKKQQGFKAWTPEQFRQAIADANSDHLLTSGQCDEFYAYWMQPSSGGVPFFKMQKAWDTRLRMQNAKRMVYDRQGGGGTSNRSGLAIGQIYQGNDDEPLPF